MMVKEEPFPSSTLGAATEFLSTTLQPRHSTNDSFTVQYPVMGGQARHQGRGGKIFVLSFASSPQCSKLIDRLCMGLEQLYSRRTSLSSRT
jgi:hypothetical protein